MEKSGGGIGASSICVSGYSGGRSTGSMRSHKSRCASSSGRGYLRGRPRFRFGASALESCPVGCADPARFDAGCSVMWSEPALGGRGSHTGGFSGSTLRGLPLGRLTADPAAANASVSWSAASAERALVCVGISATASGAASGSASRPYPTISRSSNESLRLGVAASAASCIGTLGSPRGCPLSASSWSPTKKL